MDRGDWWATIHGISESDASEGLSSTVTDGFIRALSLEAGAHLNVS